MDEFLKLLCDRYSDPVIIGFGLCVLLHLIKRGVETKLCRELGLMWYFLAWGLGTAAAFVVPQDCSEQGWRCFMHAAINYGAASLVMYPLTKRIEAKLKTLILSSKSKS